MDLCSLSSHPVSLRFFFKCTNGVPTTPQPQERFLETGPAISNLGSYTSTFHFVHISFTKSLLCLVRCLTQTLPISSREWALTAPTWPSDPSLRSSCVWVQRSLSSASKAGRQAEALSEETGVALPSWQPGLCFARSDTGQGAAPSQVWLCGSPVG